LLCVGTISDLVNHNVFGLAEIYVIYLIEVIA